MIHNGAINDKTNRTSERYIDINACNIQRSRKRAHTVIREAGRVDYHVLYIEEGECLCLYEKTKTLMKQGDFVIYPPHVPQRYSFMEGTAVTTMWVHFCGTGIPEIFDELGLKGGIYHTGIGADVEHHFRKMINHHAIGTPKHRYAARGYLMNLLSTLSSCGSEAPTYPDTVFRMIEYIHLNWQKKLSVADVAKTVRLSESRAAHLFRETVGKSIHRYVCEQKLSSAKELLESTELSVSEISAIVGFDDPLYFSRAFKAFSGVSPTALRHVSR